MKRSENSSSIRYLSNRLKKMSDLDLVRELKRILTMRYTNWLSIRCRADIFMQIHAELDARKYRGARPQRNLFRVSSDLIEKALQQVDPMSILSRESDPGLNYSEAAKLIYHHFQQEMPLTIAMKHVFSEMFSATEGELVKFEDVIESICNISTENNNSSGLL